VIVHLNGRLVRHEDACISPFDRGFLFGDGIYEGLRAVDGHIVAMREHIDRMRDGMDEMRLHGFDPQVLRAATTELLAANDLRDAFVYWHVTRGAPSQPRLARVRTASIDAAPTVFGFATSLPPLESYTTPQPITAATRPDTRWERCHIKSTSLLGGLLGIFEAAETGHEDVIYVRGTRVAEGSATNVFLTMGGRVITPSLESTPMLAGVTRGLLLRTRPDIEEHPVSLQELRSADEVMLVGTSSMVRSVVQLDGQPVGTGAPGPAATELLADLRRAIQADIHSAHD
jgi:D-alanine transaminase